MGGGGVVLPNITHRLILRWTPSSPAITVIFLRLLPRDVVSEQGYNSFLKKGELKWASAVV
jgi:hypothetical protein